MKCVLRMADVIESAELHPLATKLIAQAFAKRREDFPEATMLIETAPDGDLVYILVGSHAPELIVSGRSAYAVFQPPEAQAPVASFAERDQAQAWAAATYPENSYAISQTDPGDQPVIRDSVAPLIARGDDFLFARIAASKQWILPEAPLEVGESPLSAARRAATAVGIKADQWKIPINVPYINAYFSDAERHILTLCIAGVYRSGATSTAGTLYDKVEWLPKNSVPKPLSPTLRAAIQVADPAWAKAQRG